MLERKVFVLAIALSLPTWLQSQAAKEVKETKPAVSHYPPDRLTEFSATMVGSLTGNIDELPIYRSGKLMRTGMLDGNYMISDLSTSDTYAIMPKRCVHSDKLPVTAFPFTPHAAAIASEPTHLRDEVWAGHQCRVESLTLNGQGGAGGMLMRLWEAEDLQGFPLKVEVEHHDGRVVTIEYKDVKIGPPDPAMFKHPAKCNPAPGKP